MTPSNSDLVAALPEADLLPICPVCGYSLHLQPIQHRCPECGFEFDRRALVFRGEAGTAASRRSARPLQILAAALFAWPLLVILTTTFTARVPWPVPAIAIPLLILLDWMFLRRKRPEFILVGPTGVAAYRGVRCGVCVPWNVIQSARLDPFRKTIVLMTETGPVVLCKQVIFGLYFVEIDRCIAAINARARSGLPPASA